MPPKTDDALAKLVLERGKATPEQVADARELAAKMRGFGLEKDVLDALVERGVISGREAESLRMSPDKDDEELARLVLERGKATPQQVADARALAAKMRGFGLEKDVLDALVERGVISGPEAESLRTSHEEKDEELAGVVVERRKATSEQVDRARELAAKMRELGLEKDVLDALVERGVISSDEAASLRKGKKAGRTEAESETLQLAPDPLAPAPSVAPRGPSPPGLPPCANHPYTAGVFRCAVCGKSICTRCAINTPKGIYCSQKCSLEATLAGGPEGEGRGIGGLVAGLPLKQAGLGLAVLVVAVLVVMWVLGPSAELKRARELKAAVLRLEAKGKTKGAVAAAKQLASVPVAMGELELEQLIDWGKARLDTLRLAAARAEFDVLRKGMADLGALVRADLMRYRRELAKLAEKHSKLPRVKTAAEKLIAGIDERIERIETEDEAGAIEAQLSAAEAVLNEARREAEALVKASRYRDALEAIERRRGRLPAGMKEEFGEELDDLKKETLADVRAVYERKEAAAERHVRDRRYGEAEEIYRDVIDTFGIDEITRKARKSLARLRAVRSAAREASHRSRTLARSAQAGGKRDRVTLKSGDELSGFIVSESKTAVVLDLVSKRQTMRTTIRRDEIEAIHRLSEDERAAARENLDKIQKKAPRDALAQNDVKVQRAALTSEEARSFGMKVRGTKRKTYVKKVELEHFVIVADLEEDHLRKVALRLAKVFGAYKAHFGVDRNESKRIHVVVFKSMAEYHNAIGSEVTSPAFYSPDLKLIAGGWEMGKYRAAIVGTRVQHLQLSNELSGLNHQLKEVRSRIEKVRANAEDAVRSLNEKLQRLGKVTKDQKALAKETMRDIRQRKLEMEAKYDKYGGDVGRRVKDVQRKIKECNRKNARAFEEHTEAMIRAMYHEGFHAFLDRFLFDEELVKHVPPWLNEGLAQYFENALVEAGRLILGREDRARMRALRRFKRGGSLVSIEKMVTADAKEYLVREIGNVEKSGKHYLMAWCVVHLLGEKGRLTGGNLRAFVARVSLGGGRARMMEALPVLTGMTNAELQAELDKRLESGIKGEIHDAR